MRSTSEHSGDGVTVAGVFSSSFPTLISSVFGRVLNECLLFGGREPNIGP
ncbi:MAG: hypothetical protein JWO39_2987 [Gemmatimonadetes bacterium]|nr:hypothetical protein [Gemmatimonadota bacterium]